MGSANRSVWCDTARRHDHGDTIGARSLPDRAAAPDVHPDDVQITGEPAAIRAFLRAIEIFPAVPANAQARRRSMPTGAGSERRSSLLRAGQPRLPCDCQDAAVGSPHRGVLDRESLARQR